ncbi:MAG: DUF2878 domain-containing protein [Acidiferrobacterales bacterium]
MNLAINIVGFQIGWFAAVLGGANALPWAGTGAMLTLVVLHLLRAASPRKELQLVTVAGLIGLAWESALVSLGITSYPSGTMVPGTAPHWIVAMWMLFATTINVSLRWLRNRTWLAALTGSVSGPLAFYAGHRLGGVEFAQPTTAMIVLAIGWAVFVPLLVWLGNWLEGERGKNMSSEARYV